MVDLARMKAAILIVLMVLFGAASPGQQAPPPSAPGTSSSDLGFTYSVPKGWELLDTPATLAQQRAEASQSAASEEEKKGVACLRPILMARDQSSGSILFVEALPFGCFGHVMSNEDLPGFASAAPEVLKQSFDVGDPVHVTYALGTHNMWIERARATLKNHPEVPFTVEITCGLLKKAAVCWMAVAENDNALHAFESAAVTLDGETVNALVPPGAFGKKPS